MKNVKILAVGGLIALIVVLLVVVVTHKAGETETGVMGLREAERRTERLKQKITVPIDGATREKIKQLTDDLAREHEFTDVNGKKYVVSTVAIWELRKIGEAALPQLIDTARDHNDPTVRQYSLGVISYIYKDQKGDVMDVVPVFVRSFWDKEKVVRETAVVVIASMARGFFRQKREKELTQLIPYLVKSLHDQDEFVQATAAEGLYRIGKKGLVPKELIEKYAIDKRSY